MSFNGSKLYVGALFAVAVAMRATIGDAGFAPAEEVKVAWALNGIAAGLGTIIGPEASQAIRDTFARLTQSGSKANEAEEKMDAE